MQVFSCALKQIANMMLFHDIQYDNGSFLSAYGFGSGRELVKEQAETFFDQIEYKIVTEKMPEGL